MKLNHSWGRPVWPLIEHEFVPPQPEPLCTSIAHGVRCMAPLSEHRQPEKEEPTVE
jgi:hypothetical protein